MPIDCQCQCPRICTGRQLAAISAAAGCPWEPGHPGYARPKDRTWRFVEAFPVGEIHGLPDWEGWYANERAAAREASGGAGSLVALERAIASRTDLDPIVLAEGPDRRYYVWHGCRRTAAARFLGVATLPAIVGFRSGPIRCKVRPGCRHCPS